MCVNFVKSAVAQPRIDPTKNEAPNTPMNSPKDFNTIMYVGREESA